MIANEFCSEGVWHEKLCCSICERGVDQAANLVLTTSVTVLDPRQAVSIDRKSTID